MPTLTKLTREEFEATEEEPCTKPGKKPTVRVYSGDVPVTIREEIDDVVIAPGTYKWLMFVPCELVGELNWVRGLSSTYVTALKTDNKGNYTISPYGMRKPRKPAGDYIIIDLENSGVLFAGV